MIISRAHNFGFVHIAKCAGSTIRQQLRELDDAGGLFYQSIDVPDLGWINGQHVSLAALEQYFPENLEALTQVTSYAISREPVDRFVSGVAQYIRDLGAEPAELSRCEIETHATDVIAYMESLTGLPDRQHVLFARQMDYVALAGDRIVTHVYAMEDIDALFDVMETRHGLTLIREGIWNPTVTYRFPILTRGIKVLKDSAKAILPTSAYVAARELGVRTLTEKGVPKLYETLNTSAKIMSFIVEYYAEDRALYEEARGKNANHVTS